jgi:hypothetical protein
MFVQGFNNWLNWEIRENLFENGVPFSELAATMRLHSAKRLGDRRKAVRFFERWKELALRAVVFLGARVEKERSQ